MRLPGRAAASSAVDARPDDAAPDPDGGPSEPPAAPAAKVKRPLYPRLLRLRHVRPNAWQRAVLGEGAIALAVVLVLADVASAWTLLALPVAVAVIVKAHDLLAGLLARPPRAAAEPAGPAEVEPVESTEPVERAEPSGPRA